MAQQLASDSIIVAIHDPTLIPFSEGEPPATYVETATLDFCRKIVQLPQKEITFNDILSMAHVIRRGEARERS